MGAVTIFYAYEQSIQQHPAQPCRHGGRAVLCLGATVLLLTLSSGHAMAQSSDGPGIEWVLPQEHRLFLNGVPGDATIDGEWPMVTGIPEGDIEFDKTSS